MKMLLWSVLGLLPLFFAPTPDCYPDAAPAFVQSNYDNGLHWDRTNHDFGDIAQGQPQTAEFVVTNTGSEILLITDVKSSCGCTAAQHDTGPIGAGESTTITATYNAKKPGPFRKTVKVSTNRQDSPIVLTVQGTVIE